MQSADGSGYKANGGVRRYYVSSLRKRLQSATDDEPDIEYVSTAGVESVASQGVSVVARGRGFSGSSRLLAPVVTNRSSAR